MNWTPEEFVLFAFVSIAASCFGVVLVYVLIRTAGIAWYRSKYDHFKKVMKQLGRNGDIL